MNILGHFNYWIVIFLMMVGFYTIIARGNLVKKVVGLTIFQTSVFIFYISLAKIIGGTAPILVGGGHAEEEAQLSQGAEAAADWGSTALDGVLYSNPLPHVLILTAIVVGIATTALALALVVRINETYGTIEEDEIHEIDLELEVTS